MIYDIIIWSTENEHLGHRLKIEKISPILAVSLIFIVKNIDILSISKTDIDPSLAGVLYCGHRESGRSCLHKTIDRS